MNINKSVVENRKTVKKLKIIAVNVNSIIKNQRRASVMNLIKKHNPEIILLGETKLNNTHKLTYEHYNIIRTDRNEKKHGRWYSNYYLKIYKI